MDELSIDIETYSGADLKKTGVYRYVEDPDFTILLLSYSMNDVPVGTVDLTEEFYDRELWIDLLTDPTIKKTAHNAAFERLCLQKFFGVELPIEQWECTMVKAAMLGWPLSLDQVSKAMGLKEHKALDGKALIRYFSTPCKPTKSNGMRTRNLPEHNPDKWESYKAYNAQDVVVEKAIKANLKGFHIPETERRLYVLDQEINDRGLLLDDNFVRNAINIHRKYVDELTIEAVELTGLENPNSPKQLIEWFNEEMPLDVITTLRKTDIPEYLKLTDGYIHKDTLDRVFTIRQEMAKTSVKKYNAMLHCICSDLRVRGLLQFCGAGRTWRWAGRLIQIQNLPKNLMQGEILNLARDIVRAGDGDLLQLVFGNVPDTLSQLIRTAFVAPEGRTFVVSDFSAIEARVIAWLAGEKWRLEVFNNKGKIYEESASRMFKIPIEDITKGSVYRQKGKMSELALGYQGGPNAIIAIEVSNKTPIENRIPQDELPELVSAWRKASPAIVRLWYKVEEAAISAMNGQPVTIQHGIRFYFDTANDRLCIKLPSGRNLSYVSPRLRPGKFDRDQVTYMGLSDKKQWVRLSTYGGKLVENIVQAIARDLLADAMLRIDDEGYELVMDVHDEVVVDVDINNAAGHLEIINEIMSTGPDWAKGLPMAADSYETTYYYKKD